MYTVTTRIGPRVERARFERLGAALDAIEEWGEELSARGRAPAAQPPLMRRFEPVQQVLARVELAGPRWLRAGVDIRGDGSTEGYTGRLRRRLVEQQGGESAYDALRRVLEPAL